MNNIKEIFTEIYDQNKWVSGSGVGSTLNYNLPLIIFLSNYIGKYNIKSVVDFGCGDLQWMPNIFNNLNIEYCGVDVVEHLIKNHKQNYQSKKFIQSDIYDLNYDLIPDSDLYIIKDVLQHWTNDMVVEWLNEFFKNKHSANIIIINCDLENIKKIPMYKNHSSDREMNIGDFKPLSKHHEPLEKFDLDELFSWDTKKVYKVKL